MSVAPFGETAPTGSLEFNLRFAGQYYDKETGTHYNINRDYNPVTGRYIQSDPIGLDGGISTFAYVNGNPVMFVDLEGLTGTEDRQETINRLWGDIIVSSSTPSYIRTILEKSNLTITYVDYNLYISGIFKYALAYKSYTAIEISKGVWERYSESDYGFRSAHQKLVYSMFHELQHLADDNYCHDRNKCPSVSLAKRNYFYTIFRSNARNFFNATGSTWY